MTVLRLVAEGLEAIESGEVAPPSVDHLRECEATLRTLADFADADLAAMTDDLTAMFLRYADLGRSPVDAVIDWATEWALT